MRAFLLRVLDTSYGMAAVIIGGTYLAIVLFAMGEAAIIAAIR